MSRKRAAESGSERIYRYLKINLTSASSRALRSGMDERDFPRSGRAAQEALRRRASWLLEREGPSQGEVVLLVGVHRQTVNVRVERGRELGEDGVLDGLRVAPRRGKGLLTEAQVARCGAGSPPSRRRR